MGISRSRQRAPYFACACVAAGLALALSGCAPTVREQAPAAPVQPAEAPATAARDSWLEDVTTVAAYRDSPSRGQAIQQLLNAATLHTDAVLFEHEDLRGTNLIATVSGDAGKPLLLLGAHYDQAEVGHGVTDNAAGSAVVLALARRFQQRPLTNHRVAAAFWDLEEKGLLGAKAYISGGSEKPALYVNFDVFGWGDTVWMMAPDPANPLVAASAEAARARGLQIVSGTDYPPTDHLAFLKADWPAVSYSLVDRDEIEPILKVFKREAVVDLPKVMRVIHSEHDTIEQVDAAEVKTAIDAVEAALRAWDAGQNG